MPVFKKHLIVTAAPLQIQSGSKTAIYSAVTLKSLNTVLKPSKAFKQRMFILEHIGGH